MKYIFAVAVMILISGCRDVKEVTTFTDLKSLAGKQIEIVTLDSTIYVASAFTVNDNSIELKGYKQKDYKIESYEGEILFDRIVYIQTGNVEFLHPVYIASAVIVFSVVGAETFQQSQLTSEIIKPGGGSCPYVYSWNGTDYKIEGESFGTALGRALETETAVVLSSAVPVNGKVKIKFTNERPETHFFNSINLYASEIPAGSDLYIDSKNNPAAVSSKLNIIQGEDHKGTDITAKLISEDNDYWESDISTANKYDNYEDKIYLTIKAEEKVDSISLLVTAINTEIMNEVFGYLAGFLGKDLTSFTRAAETDKELIEILKNALERSALKVDVWDGKEWMHSGKIYPEANHVKFRKLVRLPVINNTENKIKIRLRMLTNIWKLDHVSYDNTINLKPITRQPVLIRMDNEAGKILKKDEKYLRLLPGEEINLTYNEIPAGKGMKIVYTANASGYLYEYIICEGDDISVMDLVNPDFPKLDLLKLLLSNDDLFLKKIYKY